MAGTTYKRAPTLPESAKLLKSGSNAVTGGNWSYQSTTFREKHVRLTTGYGYLMDMLPISALSEEQRTNQYFADVTLVNAERLTRGETALDPNTLESRERWNTAQVNNHKSLFSFSDKLTTLMFIVASDLIEAQRERETHKFPFSSVNECPRLFF